MKNFRRLTAMVLALVMCLSLTVTAFATEEETYSITIENAVDGETYSAYKILDVTYATVTGEDETEETIVTYYISADSAYYEAFAANAALEKGALFTLVQEGEKYQVVVNDGVENDAIIAFIKGLTLGSATATATASVAEDEEEASCTISITEPGYYYVTTSLGSVVSIGTASPDATIAEKNSTPTDTKVVEEDSTKTTGNTNTAAIGDTVSFTATISDAVNVKNVVFHDTMSDGLTFDENSVVVTIGETKITTGYTLVTSDLEDDCTFEIVFANGTITDKVTITYSATVNSDAVIGGNGNANKETVTYGNDQETTGNTTTTYVFEFKLVKTDSDENVLDGAVFTLTPVDEHNGTSALTFVYDEEEGTYTLSDSEDASANIEVGSATIIGLDAGTYTLTEISAPDGYNKLTESITVTIAEDGTVSIGSGDDAETVDSVTVENSAGATLPSTGGMGTTVFYVVGSMMVLAALVLLVTKKRMANAQ